MLVWLFSKFWRKRLEGRKVIKVKGWRTALVDTTSDRMTTTFMIKIWKWWL